MASELSSTVCIGGFFLGGERPEVSNYPVSCYFSFPSLSRFIGRNTFYSSSATPVNLGVPHVLHLRYVPKVMPTIVESASVDVVIYQAIRRWTEKLVHKYKSSPNGVVSAPRISSIRVPSKTFHLDGVIPINTGKMATSKWNVCDRRSNNKYRKFWFRLTIRHGFLQSGFMGGSPCKDSSSHAYHIILNRLGVS